MKTKKIVTDSLGFRLEVHITVGPLTVSGKHICYEDERGIPPIDTIHEIKISEQLTKDDPAYMAEVVAHEVYNLFQSVRPHISIDIETEATVFGQLVKQVHGLILS